MRTVSLRSSFLPRRTFSTVSVGRRRVPHILLRAPIPRSLYLVSSERFEHVDTVATNSLVI
jgi:hypothetical protein